MKHMKKMAVFALAMVLSMLLGANVYAAEEFIGNATTLSGGVNYTMTVGTEYYTTLPGAPGYVSFVTPAQEGYVTVHCKNITIGSYQYFAVKTAINETLKEDTWVSNGGGVNWEFKSEVGKKNGAKLEPNTRYYILLGENTPSGNVKVSVTFRADANANSKAEAETVALNTDYTRSIDSWDNDDTDYYKFQATSSGRYRLTINNAGGNYLHYQLRNWATDELVKNTSNRDINESWCYANDTHVVDADLEAGQWYYLKVWNNKTGNYTFSFSNQLVTSIAMAQSVMLDRYVTYQLQTVVSPALAFNKTLKFESSNTDVATVNDKGEVYARSTGFATITASATDGSGVTATCLVTVKPGQSYYPEFTKSSTDYIKVNWSQMSGVDGYVLYYRQAKGKWKTVTTTKNSYTVKKLKSGTTYQFKVRGYINVNGIRVEGTDSETKNYCTTPAKTSISKMKRLSPKKSYNGKYYRVKITWKKVSGASYYKLYVRMPGSRYKSCVGTYYGTSATYQRYYSRGSRDSKTIYFYVEPVRKVNDREFAGAISKSKKYKMK